MMPQGIIDLFESIKINQENDEIMIITAAIVQFTL